MRTCETCHYAVSAKINTPPFSVLDCHGVPPDMASAFVGGGQLLSGTVQRTVDKNRPACSYYVLKLPAA